MTPWEEAKRILCVRLDTLGDVWMMSPAIRAVREADADRNIALLTSPAGSEAARLIPEIDDIIVYEAPWMKATPARDSSRVDVAMIESLRARAYDAAIIFTTYSQSPMPAALLCYLSDIPLRLAHAGENPYQLLTDHVEDPEPHRFVRHEVQRQLDLVAAVGYGTHDPRLSVTIPDSAWDRVAGILVSLDVDIDKPWIVMHTGATAPSRRYPAESYGRVGHALVTDLGLQVLLTGTERERKIVDRVRSMMQARSTSLVDLLSVAELGALLARAQLLVSNNTGPVHLASAFGTPVVDLYALTNPQHTPWHTPHRVLFHDVPCKYCYKSICPEGHHNCLRKVPPEAVVAAVEELISGAVPPDGSGPIERTLS